MKKHTMPSMQEGGVNVTPLIDIVMCLIIFFMLVAKIGVSRGALKAIDLPMTVLGKEMKDFANTLTLNIQPTNLDEPQITTQVDGVTKDIKIIDRNSGQVERPLLAILKKYKESHATGSIIIRADRDLAYKQLEQVLLTCADAEISNIAYETKPNEESPGEAPPVDAAAAASAQ